MGAGAASALAEAHRVVRREADEVPGEELWSHRLGERLSSELTFPTEVEGFLRVCE